MCWKPLRKKTDNFFTLIFCISKTIIIKTLFFFGVSVKKVNNMEFENLATNADFHFDFVTNLINEPTDIPASSQNELSVEGLRKHFYLDILAASC